MGEEETEGEECTGWRRVMGHKKKCGMPCNWNQECWGRAFVYMEIRVWRKTAVCHGFSTSVGGKQ